MNIYIIRHGETNANKDHRLQGIINEPLNDYGRKLALLTGSNMKDIKFDICFSSPLDRALDTAKIVLKESGNKDCQIITDTRIQEINMGSWEGKVFMPPNNEIPVWKILLFHKNPFLIGRFRSGESIKDVIKRTSGFLEELYTKEYDNVLVSTHGCAMRAMLNSFYKNRFNFWQEGVPYNCAVNIIEVNNGVPKLVEKDKIYYDASLIKDNYKK